MSEFRLQVEGIWKAFPGTQALTDVSMAVRPGEVHALIGENGAGKSTLMNIVGGVFQQDKGSIHMDGRRVSFKNPTEAQRGGVGFVHQELSLFQHLSVSKNIYVDRMPMTPFGTIDKKKLRSDAKQILKIFNFDIDPDTVMADLTIGNQQLIEIIRAISLDARLIIFDEPTSSLSENEAKMLFRVIRSLKESGISVIYISHRLSEVFEISDMITVLKDGCVVDTCPTASTNLNDTIRKMVGREMTDFYPPKSSFIGEDMLRVEHFSDGRRFKDVSFTLRRGEVLGFYGLVGAGRSELLRAVCGLEPRESGRVFWGDRELHIRNYLDAMREGIAYLTEDRKMSGIFPSQSVCRNLLVSDMCVSGGAWMRTRGEQEKAEEDVRRHSIKTSSVLEQALNLSGGNQQKVLIARNLRINPKMIILDEPTRGIDVNSKAAIHNKIRDLAEAGMGAIVISSEMPEIIGVSDRVIILHEGRVTGELTSEEINEQSIIQCATNVRAPQ